MWGLEPGRYGRKKMREDASSRGGVGGEGAGSPTGR